MDHLYKDLSFDDYVKLQREEAGEWEGGWADQMVNAFLESTKDLPKDAAILDVGCHLGRGLYELQRAGFTNAIGVELVPEKVESARERGLTVHQADMHDLSMFEDEQFDFAFMSHTIEHAMDPLLALQEVTRVSKAGLIICPLDQHVHELGSDPHTSPFTDADQWRDLWNKLTPRFQERQWSLTHTSKMRLGFEVWTEYREIN